MNIIYKSTITGFTLFAIILFMPTTDTLAQTIQKVKPVQSSAEPDLKIINAKKSVP